MFCYSTSFTAAHVESCCGESMSRDYTQFIYGWGIPNFSTSCMAVNSMLANAPKSDCVVRSRRSCDACGLCSMKSPHGLQYSFHFVKKLNSQKFNDYEKK